MNNKNVQFRIQSIFNDLTRSERKIAQFIMDQPDEAIKMTASELALASSTSPASIIRFCKSIGIPSFTELKLELSAERSTPIVNEYSDILPNEKVSDLKTKLLGNAYQALKETVNLADDDILHQASKLIKEAQLIYVYGIGSSYLVAENIAQKWNRIGKICICKSDVHQLISDISSATQESLFIGISSSGETFEVISLNNLAKSRKLKTISITGFGMNTLSKNSDINLNSIRSKEVELRSAATSSLMSQFILTDILFYTYLLEDYDSHIKYITDSRKVIDKYKQLIQK